MVSSVKHRSPVASDTYFTVTTILKLTFECSTREYVSVERCVFVRVSQRAQS